MIKFLITLILALALAALALADDACADELGCVDIGPDDTISAFQLATMARFAAEALGLRSVATIDDGDPYTRGLASAMASAFESLDGDVVFRGRISRGDTDMSAMLAAIAEAGGSAGKLSSVRRGEPGLVRG